MLDLKIRTFQAFSEKNLIPLTKNPVQLCNPNNKMVIGETFIITHATTLAYDYDNYGKLSLAVHLLVG